MNQTTRTFESLDGTRTGGGTAQIGHDRTILHLEGELDLSMAEEFGQFLLTLPTTTPRLDLDLTGLNFCDCTLTQFVATMSELLPVTVATPNRWVMEFLRLVDVPELVRILDQK